MSAIRPDLSPPPALIPTGPSAQARAAQAAFFRAALQETTAATAPSSGPAREPEVARQPRPGQLLDIRV